MSAEQIQYLPLDRIAAAPQVREHFDEESLTGLAQSMREVGQQQPIRVRRDGDRLVIVDGERRFRAAKKAGFTTIAVVIEEKELCDAEVLHRQLVANCQREDLSPVEKARAIDRLMKETGWSASQTAAKLGYSNATLSRLRGSSSFSPELLGQVESGAVPFSSAVEIARVEDPQEQAQLAAQAAAGQLTRDQISGKRKAKERCQNGAAAAAPSRVTAKLGGGRTVTVSGSALTLEAFIALIEEILTRARASRTKGHSLATLITVLADEARRAG